MPEVKTLLDMLDAKAGEANFLTDPNIEMSTVFIDPHGEFVMRDTQSKCKAHVCFGKLSGTDDDVIFSYYLSRSVNGETQWCSQFEFIPNLVTEKNAEMIMDKLWKKIATFFEENKE